MENNINHEVQEKKALFCPYCGKKIGSGEGHVCKDNNRTELTFIEAFLRKALGVFLILSAVPLLLNIITIPLVIFCIVFGIYMISGKRYNMTFDLMGLFIGGIIYFLAVFNSFKVMLFYAVPVNNDFRGFLIFSPAVIILLISSLYMFIQGVLRENKSHGEAKNRGTASFMILVFIILLVLGLPMIKHLDVKLGIHEGTTPDGSKQDATVSFSQEHWTYIIKKKNDSDKPLIVSGLFGNKKQLSELDNITVKNGDLTDGKLTIGPQEEAVITIRSLQPFYTLTFDIEGSLADSYNFIK